VLIGRHHLSPHIPWLVLTLLLTAAASAWFFAAGSGSPYWPSGSSWPGFTFGVLGGVLILFEMLLWWRKQVRTWRIGRVQAWMRAHIWLGLLTVPLLVYHSGFRLGGPLSTVLMVLFLIVIASGIWGLILQNVLPRRLLEDVPAETIYSQIHYVVDQLGREAERLVDATCGPAEHAAPQALAMPAAGAAAGTPYLTVGAVRSAGRVQGKVLQTRVPATPVPGAEPLRAFFQGSVVPFLRMGSAARSPLQSATRAAGLFRDLRTKLPPAAHESVDTLESLCEQRRQLASQARVHFWLHNWLWLHLPLSVALVVLMFVHVFVAMKYW
jgi:hypothetical protein